MPRVVDLLPEGVGLKKVPGSLAANPGCGGGDPVEMSQVITKPGGSCGSNDLKDARAGSALDAFFDAGAVFGFSESFGDASGADPDLSFDIVSAACVSNLDGASKEAFHHRPSTSTRLWRGAKAGPGGLSGRNLFIANHLRFDDSIGLQCAIHGNPQL